MPFGIEPKRESSLPLASRRGARLGIAASGRRLRDRNHDRGRPFELRLRRQFHAVFAKLGRFVRFIPFIGGVGRQSARNFRLLGMNR